MATILDKYLVMEVTIGAAEHISPVELLRNQELFYRISVLQTCQMFSKAAPVTNETKQLVYHYQMFDGYMQALAGERRMGPCVDEDGQNRRQTAQQNLIKVINDYRQRFNQYAPTTPEQYKQDINTVIATVLPAWLQYRNTYIEIITKEETANG